MSTLDREATGFTKYQQTMLTKTYTKFFQLTTIINNYEVIVLRVLYCRLDKVIINWINCTLNGTECMRQKNRHGLLVTYTQCLQM